jgi:hypothetical protein
MLAKAHDVVVDRTITTTSCRTITTRSEKSLKIEHVRFVSQNQDDLLASGYVVTIVGEVRYSDDTNGDTTTGIVDTGSVRDSTVVGVPK